MWYMELKAKGLDKNVPNLEVGGASPVPPTPPSIWVKWSFEKKSQTFFYTYKMFFV